MKLFIILFVVLFALPASAGQQLSQPSGKVILKVEGVISRTNAFDAALFDMDMLKSIDVHTIVTETPWTDGMQTFEGPLVRDLLEIVGAVGTVIHATALNDYSVEISVSDFNEYPAILAYTLNGAPMPVRDKGPLWVIYPWSDTEEIRNELYYAKSIWQVKSLEIK